MSLVVTLSAGIVLAQPPTASNPFEFFEPQVAISPDERARLGRGESIVKALAPASRELALFSATATDFGADRLVAWVRRIDELKKGPYVPAVARFSNPPRLDDLASLELDQDDLDVLRNCRPGACGLKLSEAEIQVLAGVASSRQRGWQADVQRAFREVMLNRANVYLRSGFDNAAPYRDRGDAVALDVEFQSILKNSAFLSQRMPVLTDFLTRFPQAPADGVESFLYWSKEQLGGRPLVSITHVTIVRHWNGTLPEVVVASRQVFGTHYVTGSLALTTIVGGRDGGTRYLAYLNRSRVDLLDGLFGGLVRRVMERRLRSEAGEVVDALRRRMAAGEPPRSAHERREDR